MSPLSRHKRPPNSSSRCRQMVLDTHLQQDRQGYYLVCHACGGRIDPVRKKNSWQADHHPVPVANGGKDEPENLKPLCIVCASSKNADDWRTIAHGRRMANKHFGV